MRRSSSVDSRQTIPAFGTPEHAVWLRQRFHDIDMFFQKGDPVYQTMRKLSALLEQRQIVFVIAGGMAVNAHGYRRTTADVDFLVRADGLEAIRQLAREGVLEPVRGRSRRFTARESGVQVDVLVTGMFPGTGKPGPISFPDPLAVREQIENLPFVNLKSLVELKLAAHRHKDFGDVVEVIRARKLDEGFLAQLHPSVHGDFIECLEEKRREDEYEERNG